ncbi:MAG: class E sortase [Actinobacteria bacterium]|nr:MAG: class E sortase [Actinomycetota bacterium]
MRRGLRVLGTALVISGVAALAWTLVVWRWQDPFTAVYTAFQQHRLARQYDRLVAAYKAPRLQSASLAAVRHAVVEEAQRYRLATHQGEAIGRIVVPRLHLNMVFVDGTDEGSLEKGPGRDLHTYMPGEGRLVYIAGHRTTFLAPFSHIERLRRGDSVALRMPYATFVYRITRHRIVAADDLSVLRSPHHEVLALQACHPRFFATHRYIAYARPVRVMPENGPAWSIRAIATG